MNITKNTVSLSIVVQWDEVDDSLPTTYTVTWTSERDQMLSSDTLIEQSSYTITGLTLDTVYTITVTAINICGTGPEYKTSVSLTSDTSSTTSNHAITVSTNTMTIMSTPSPTITSAVVDLSTSYYTTNSMTSPVKNPTGTTSITSSPAVTVSINTLTISYVYSSWTKSYYHFYCEGSWCYYIYLNYYLS